jgi:hypothetical protein
MQAIAESLDALAIAGLKYFGWEYGSESHRGVLGKMESVAPKYFGAAILII